jgi:hypothetical protein
MSPKKRPVCDTPGCGRSIPIDGEGYPEICPVCLACLAFHNEKSVYARGVADGRRKALEDATAWLRARGDDVFSQVTWAQVAKQMLDALARTEEDSHDAE